MSILQKYYIDDTAGGGGGDPKTPTAPKGYSVTTPQQRTEWNGFLDYLDKQGVAGKPDLDQAGAGLKYFQQYKKANPTISLTPEHVQNIQYEQYQLRKGDQFGSLNKMQLDHLRSGLAPAYLNRPVSDVNGQINSATSKLYYPAGQSYGTDIEHYDRVIGQPPNSNNRPVVQTGNVEGAVRPDYNKPQSRIEYLKNMALKHGDFVHGRGDTILHVNDTPRNGTTSAKNIALNTFGKLGIDPALGYASSMEEGMSGEFAGKDGNYKYEQRGTKEFPVEGSAIYGLDNFVSRFPELVKKGYLPASFKDKFTPYHSPDPGETQDSALYKTADDALAAKAAFLKSNYDEAGELAKKNKVTLSPRAKDFFALVNYNAGTGTGAKMLKDYADNGLLKDDAFLKNRPTVGKGLKESSYKQVYENVINRLKMADLLKKEKYFD